MDDLLPKPFADLIRSRPTWAALRIEVQLRSPGAYRDTTMVFVGGRLDTQGLVWAVAVRVRGEDVFDVGFTGHGSGESLRAAMLGAIQSRCAAVGRGADAYVTEARRVRLPAKKESAARQAADLRLQEAELRELAERFPDVWPAP